MVVQEVAEHEENWKLFVQVTNRDKSILLLQKAAMGSACSVDPGNPCVGHHPTLLIWGTYHIVRIVTEVLIQLLVSLCCKAIRSHLLQPAPNLLSLRAGGKP